MCTVSQIVMANTTVSAYNFDKVSADFGKEQDQHGGSEISTKCSLAYLRTYK